MTNTTEQTNQFRVEVIADNSGIYCGNGLTFPTIEDATKYAKDLMWRWTLVRSWRVIDSTGTVQQAKG